MRIPFLSDSSVYAEDHLGRVFSFLTLILIEVTEGLAFRIGKGYTYCICYK